MKISELSGFDLDWAVYQALRDSKSLIAAGLHYTRDEFYDWWDKGYHRYSSEYNAAGPVIVQYKIGSDWNSIWRQWTAWIGDNEDAPGYVEQSGPSLTVASMRCYVASRFGEKVPDER